VIFGLPWGYFILAVVVGILSAGRLTRLVTADQWPPVVWVRDRWTDWTQKTERRQGWFLLLNCHWCFSPWAMLGVGAWAVLCRLEGWFGTAWWLFNGWLAASYVVAMVVHRDEGPGED